MATGEPVDAVFTPNTARPPAAFVVPRTPCPPAVLFVPSTPKPLALVATPTTPADAPVPLESPRTAALAAVAFDAPIPFVPEPTIVRLFDGFGVDVPTSTWPAV